MSDVILHAFDWHYAEIANNVEKIAGLGYGAVLIPPPLYSGTMNQEKNGGSGTNRRTIAFCAHSLAIRPISKRPFPPCMPVVREFMLT